MARVKRAVNAQKKRRVVLEQASGYRGQRSRLYRKAKEQVTHSLTYSYRDRRAKKGDFRKLWIQRINAAARCQHWGRHRGGRGVGGEARVVGQAEASTGALTSSGRFALASSTRATNAGASLTARSARILRSTSTPAAFSPWMNRL